MAKQRIIIGITGGIAAYKTPAMVRGFLQAGWEVEVVLTHNAAKFVAPMALQGVLGKPIHGPLDEGPSAMRHIELAKWADVVLIAPATANQIAQLALGLANDLLGNICLATTAQRVICPAMNQQMFKAPSVQANLATLRQQKVEILGPDWGQQACGDIGPGRMLEPADIINRLQPSKTLQAWSGKRVLLTAGPTREAIDPVRFLSNRSSGKMGYALAEHFAEQGAEVLLVSGPCQLPCPQGVERISVITCAEMLSSVMANIEGVDLFVGVAAVADYRPAEVAEHKIKKGPAQWTLVLEKTPDILFEVAQLPQSPFCVGFAAETHNGSEFARAKLKAKQIDLIACNDVSNSEIGFDSNENALTVFSSKQHWNVAQASKSEIAQQLAQIIASEYTKIEVKVGTA